MENNVIEKPNILLSKYIGHGTSGIVFKKDKEIIKLYYSFINFELDKLLYLKSCNNNSFVFPNKIIMDNDKVKGYTSKYIKGVNISKYNGNILNLMFALNKLIDDIRIISNYKISLGDITKKDIIYSNNKIYFIDLDRCFIEEDMSEDYIFRKNVKIVIEELFKGLFNIKEDHAYNFASNEYNDLFYNISNDYNDLFTLVEKIIDDTNETEVSKIRKKVLVNSLYDEYHYKPYL